MNLSGASQKLNEIMRIYFRDIGIVFKKIYFAIFVEIICFCLNYSALARKDLPILVIFFILHCKIESKLVDISQLTIQNQEFYQNRDAIAC